MGLLSSHEKKTASRKAAKDERGAEDGTGDDFPKYKRDGYKAH